MNIMITNNISESINLTSPELIKTKELVLEKKSSGPLVTLSSLDTPIEKVTELFENAAKQVEEEINAVSVSLDKKKLRELRKKEKLVAKQERASKSLER